MKNLFKLNNKTALITGGGGLLGPKHAEALLEYGAEIILCDHHLDKVRKNSEKLNKMFNNKKCTPHYMDVTKKDTILNVIKKYSKINILINNAAKDPKIKKGQILTTESRFENMTEDYWFEGIDAAMNGIFLCSQLVGKKMLDNGGGVILNISSDLGVIAPDQRIYHNPDLEEDQQSVKPITYSAAKWAVIGMTKYLAIYWAKKNIRVNCLSPTGVYNDHPEEFVKKLSNIIPLGRMADINEYKAAIVFLCSDASSYMTGENLVIDGGKTVW